MSEAMTLPNDYWRCNEAGLQLCDTCARRTPPKNPDRVIYSSPHLVKKDCLDYIKDKTKDD